MSKTVDERLVSMQFDNRQFERNVQQSMSTLDKLKEKLNLSGAAKGFDEVNAASKKVNFSGLNSGIEAVHAKFSALQVMGVTALSNITNSAVNAGKRIASALTIDPIKTGFQEYETQINAVQTILANTQHEGTNLQQVNRALDELNAYADKTIYNFAEMTRNIGTFTAAGVNLQTSVDSIKGIANLAAVSGSSAMQASTVMYQLSQAVAAGKVSLMDWNSVVNAGMGGKVFQDALVRTSELLKTGAKQAIDTYGSFRESLTKGEWLTTEVLTETLKQFAGAYDEADLIAQGFTEEQAKEIAAMAKTAEEAATKVKTFTQLWDTLKESAQSGWTQTWEILIGDFGEAKETLTEISEAIGGVIGRAAEARNEMLSAGLSSGWKQLLGAGIADEAGYIESIQEVARKSGDAFDKMVADSEDFSDALKAGLKDGVISSDTLSEAVHNLEGKMSSMSEEELKAAGYTTEMVEQIKELSSGLKDGSVSMDEFTEKILRPSGRENLIQSLWNAAKGLMSVLTPIGEAFREIFPRTTGDQLYEFTVRLEKFTEKLTISGETAGKLKTTFKGLFAALDIVVTVIKELAGGAATLIGKLTGLGGGILDVTSNFGNWLINLRDTVKETDVLGTAIDKVTGFLSGVIDKIKDFGVATKEGFSESNFGGFASFLQGLWDIIQNIGVTVGEVFSTIGTTIAGSFNTGTIFELLNSGLFAGILFAIKKFIGTLTDSFDGVGGMFENVSDILENVGGTLEAWQSNLKAGTLLKIAGAVGILTTSILVLSSIDAAQLGQSLGAITVLFGELLAALAIFTKLSGTIMGTLTIMPMMIAMSSAILVLTGAMKVLSTISWDGIAKGLTSIAGLLVELAIGLNLMKGTLGGSAALLVAANALLVLTPALMILSYLSWDNIARGLTAIGGALLELGIGLHLMNGTLGGSAALLVASNALLVMTPVMLGLSAISWDGVAKGLVVIGGALAELAIGLHLMNGTLGGSAALLIASGALAVLAPSIMLLSAISWEGIAKGLTVLAGSFAVLGVAGLLLTPLIPAILGLSGAITLFGVSILGIGAGMALIGAGITAIAVGFTTLAGAGAAGATAFVASLSVIITGIGSLIPTIAEQFGKAIIAIAMVLGDAAPQLAESFLKLLAGVMESLATYTPQMVDSLMQFIIGIIDSLADHIPELIVSVMNFVGALFEGIISALNGIDTGTLVKGIAAVGLISALIVALSAIGPFIPGAMASILGIGIMVTELGLVLTAIGALAQIPGLQWLMGEGGQFLQLIGSAIGQFVGGIVGGFMGGVASSFPQIASDLSAFMTNLQPFIEGAKGLDASMLDGVNALAKTILILTAADILDGLTSWITGGSSLSQFAADLVPFGMSMAAYSVAVAGMDSNAVINSATAAHALAELASNLPNSGGLVGWFAGENDMSTFGAQLVPFGVSLKAYSLAVAGLDANAVTNSTIAAQSLSELAKNLPNTGGLVSWFTGDNDMATFGEQLVPFGEAMKKYSDAVIGIDSTAITNSAEAAKSLAGLSSSIENSGGLVSLFTGDNDLGSFAEQIVPLGEGLKKYSDAVAGLSLSAVYTSVSAVTSIATMMKGLSGLDTGGVTRFKNALSKMGKAGVDAFVKEFNGSTTKMRAAGSKAISGAIQGVKSKESALKSTVVKLVQGMTSAMGNEQDEFKTVGKTLLDAFNDAIKEYSKTIERTTRTIASDAAKATREKYDSFKSAGKYLVEGFAAGISEYSYIVEAKARSMARAALNAVESELDINSPSVEAQNDGEFFGEGFEQGIENSTENVAIASKQMGEAANDALIGTVSEGNTEVLAKQKELETASIESEKQYWENLLAIKQKGEEESKYKSMSMKDFEKSILDDTMDIWKNYTDQLTSTADSIMGQRDLFAAVSKEKEEVTKEELVKNLQDQIDEYNTYALTLQSLNARLANDTGLRDALNKMGVDSLAQLQAINSMTDEELSNYATLYDTKYALATNAASSQLASLQTETEQKLSALYGGVDVKLDEFAKTFDGTMKSIQKYVKMSVDQAALAKDTGKKIVDGMAEGISKNDSADKAAKDMIDDAEDAARQQAEIHSPSALFKREVGSYLTEGVAEGMKEGVPKLVEAAGILIDNIIAQFEGVYDQFYSIGEMLVDGFVSGISDNIESAAAAAAAMASAASEAARANLVINSPSKVFYGIGDYSGQGFVNALYDYAKRAYNAGSEIADSAKSGLSNALGRITDIINSDIDTDLTIRPVLDLSDINAGSKTISDMLHLGSSIGVLSNVGAISYAVDQRNQNGANDDVVYAINKLRDKLDNVGGTQYNFGDISYDDGSGIAEAVGALVRAARIERRV